MSNLLKSKFLLGVMIVAVMFVGFAVANTASAATCDLGTTTLKYGMKGDAVLCLQTKLGMEAKYLTGNFGKITKSKVMAFQTSKALKADGVVGAMTKAALNAEVVVTPTPGTTDLCPNGMTLASNCTTAPTTTPSVDLCPNGMTLASNCTTAPTTTPVTTGNGYLADPASDSTNRVSTVYESDTNKVVLGFRETAKLSDQTLTRVRVTMKNTNTSSSANLAKYATAVSLWNGSTKLAAMNVADADRATDDTYTFNFAGLSSKIAKNEIGHFYVSVDAVASLDSTDATNATWTVSIPAGAVQATSPDGSVDTYDAASSGALSVTGLKFAKFSANGIKATVNLSSSNPASSTQPVSSTNATNGMTLLKFTVKATNTDLTLKKIPVQITTTTAYPVDIINTVKLMKGSDVVDTLDGSAGVTVSSSITSGTCSTTTCGYIFTNLSAPYNTVLAEQTAEYTIVVDLKSQTAGSYSDGETITASVANADVLLVANFGVNDKNGDYLGAGSTYRVGSAVGNTQILRANGVNTEVGTVTYDKTVDSSGNITSVNYNIPLTVTSFGNTLYLGQTAQLATTATVSNAFAYVFQNSSAPTSSDVTATSSATLSTSDATIETNGFRLDSGVAKHFTLSVTLTTPTTADNSYRVALKQIRTFTEGSLTNATNNTLLPVEKYQTDYKPIHN